MLGQSALLDKYSLLQPATKNTRLKELTVTTESAISANTGRKVMSLNRCHAIAQTHNPRSRTIYFVAPLQSTQAMPRFTSVTLSKLSQPVEMPQRRHDMTAMY
jgi:hypothetical protein